MSYLAYDFIFDGIPSEKFGLFLCNIGETNKTTDNAGGNVKIHTDKTPNMEYNYLLGVEHEDVFEFTFVFGSDSPKDRFDISLINNWLMGHKQYKKLQIIQKDMTSVYFNCIINDLRTIMFGNVPYAFECTVLCDRPWALENMKTYNYDVYDGKTIIHNNISHKNGITLPIIEFTTNNNPSNVSIINKTNGNYETKFVDLINEETIFLDCNTETIKSSTGNRRLSNFNNHWFELLPNENIITFKGDISNFKIKYENVRKVGA